MSIGAVTAKRGHRGGTEGAGGGLMGHTNRPILWSLSVLTSNVQSRYMNRGSINVGVGL